ncbi:MAG: tetratricopeptide repeat protein [Deltaproteobacteria bacterium]|jgi:cytochrome c-type biogenesis protein CcmH/NrfG|nr:tetratricopeptide repeat protein [Deltaproteobacteria bacterium]
MTYFIPTSARDRAVSLPPGILPLLVLAVFVLAALFFAAPAYAAESDPARRTAVESAKAEAADLMQQGRYASAYELYMRLLREEPDDDSINLNLARSAMRATKYNQAVMAYERLIEKYPNEAGLYAELAHAYMALDDRASAEQALATMRTIDPNADPASAEAMLGVLEKRYDHLQTHGRVRFGVLYDSNANLGPASASVDLGNWRVQVPDAKAVDSFGAYLGASLDVAWKPERDSAWWLVGDVQSFVRGNAESDLDTNKSRSSEWLRGAVGLRYMSPESMLDIRLKSEIFDYQWYQNVVAMGPEITFVSAISPSLHLISRANIDKRTHSKDSKRNGAYWSAGQFARIYFGQDNHEFIVGASYNGANTSKKDDYSYNGWEGSVRFMFKLPHGVELAPFASFSQEWYDGPATALETDKRYDKSWRGGVSLTWRFSESWSVEAMYQYTDNSSRSNLYEYDQNLVSVGMAWSF